MLSSPPLSPFEAENGENMKKVIQVKLSKKEIAQLGQKAGYLSQELDHLTDEYQLAKKTYREAIQLKRMELSCLLNRLRVGEQFKRIETPALEEKKLTDMDLQTSLFDIISNTMQ